VRLARVREGRTARWKKRGDHGFVAGSKKGDLVREKKGRVSARGGGLVSGGLGKRKSKEKGPICLLIFGQGRGQPLWVP
jgi:hypothetical protein